MGKAIVFIVIFIVFIVIKVLVTASKSAIKVGKEAYTAANNGDDFSTFSKGVQESTPHGVIGLMTVISKSDGVVSEYEATAIKETIKEFVEMARPNLRNTELEEYRGSLIATYNRAKSNKYTAVYYAQKIDHSNYSLMTSIIGRLVGIAHFDGLTTIKEQMLFEVAKVLMVRQGIVNKFIAEYNDIYEEPIKKTSSEKSVDAYEILGVSKYDSFENIKKAYRKLVKKFHPDSIEGHGLDQAFVEFANQQMQIINAAFAEIKAAKSV